MFYCLSVMRNEMKCSYDMSVQNVLEYFIIFCKEDI
jgi:hypothetical protein